MSRFRRLSIDEAKETFPLINEEARKALKGGCDTCENWKIENPGIVIYSVDEWEQMSKNGNWTVGAVCGEGLMVGPNTVVYGPPRTPLCPIHPHFYGKGECSYCYFDGFQHCDEHKVYFPFTKECRECYYDQNYYNQMNYDNQTGNTGGGSGVTPPPTTGKGESDYEKDRALICKEILSHLDSSFEKECFLRYWDSKGDLALSESRFEDIKKVVEAKNINYMEGTNVVEIDNKMYYKKTFSFYDNPEYDLAFGTATVYYDFYGKMVGFKDEYDFNWTLFKREFVAELETMGTSFVGFLKGADSYRITYGIHE